MLVEKALELKYTLFETGVKRLSGGMSNEDSSEIKSPPTVVITSSFVVQYIKFNAVKTLKDPLYFKV